MRLQAFPVGGPLADYVEAFWIVQGRPDYLREKVLPNGVIEVIFNLGSPHRVVSPRPGTFFDAWIAGLHEHHLIIEAESDFDLVGIRFKPGGAAAFLRFSPAQLTNSVLEGCDISAELGTLTLRTREQLQRAHSPRERLSMLEELLCARIDPDFALAPSVRQTLSVLRRPAQSPIAALAAEARVSHKHLVAQFREQVGTTPRTLLQIQRFQRALRLVSGSSSRSVSWADVAQSAGYFDQPHLIRAFRRFADATPAQYLRHRDEDENHITMGSRPAR
jgi:AraC-like DNA-binding protein